MISVLDFAVDGMNRVVGAMDRFYMRHPRIAFGIAVTAAFACMYIASDWDKAETTAIRMQMFAAHGA